MGGDEHVLVRAIHARFGEGLADPLCFIEALQLPDSFRLRGKHVVSGQRRGNGPHHSQAVQDFR